MRRFFMSTLLSDHMEIQGEDAHHISRVLRHKVGDKILVVGQDGQVGKVLITQITPEAVLVNLQEMIVEKQEPPIKICLAQGLTKSDKMDYIIQKAVELGAEKIVPMICAHSIVKYDRAKKEERHCRWQKIAGEAAKQCGRGVTPEVRPIQGLGEVLTAGTGPDTAIIMLYEGEAPVGIKQVLANTPARSYLVLIGPEGGFSGDEVVLCRQYGAHIANMGPRILRTETAALASLSIIMYEYGDLGG